MAVKNPSYNQSGFTLIELMISLAIFGVVLAGVVFMFINTSRSHTGQEMMVELTQNVRAVKNLMVDELRSAGCNPSKVERMGFQDDTDDRFNTDGNSIHFTRDIDNGDGDQYYEPDGDAGDANEEIRYYRIDADGVPLAAGNNTPGTLVRNTGTGAGGGGYPLVDNIIELQFQYYDSSNVLIPPGGIDTSSELDEIHTIEVVIVGQVQNPGRASVANQIWTQQFRVKIRNL